MEGGMSVQRNMRVWIKVWWDAWKAVSSSGEGMTARPAQGLTSAKKKVARKQLSSDELARSRTSALGRTAPARPGLWNWPAHTRSPAFTWAPLS